jgi:hypothetical protein
MIDNFYAKRLTAEMYKNQLSMIPAAVKKGLKLRKEDRKSLAQARKDMRSQK